MTESQIEPNAAQTRVRVPTTSVIDPVIQVTPTFGSDAGGEFAYLAITAGPGWTWRARAANFDLCDSGESSAGTPSITSSHTMKLYRYGHSFFGIEIAASRPGFSPAGFSALYEWTTETRLDGVTVGIGPTDRLVVHRT